MASDMFSSDSVIDFIEDAEVASFDDRDHVLQPDIEESDELSRFVSPRLAICKLNGLSSSTIRPRAHPLSLR